MTRRQITGFSNPTVKYLRSLRDKKHRKRERKFLAEGLRLLTDARESGRLPEMLVMAEGREAHPLLTALEADVERAGGEIVETSAEILSKITGKDNPQTVAGVFAEFDTSLTALNRAEHPIWLVAQALRDPGNLGTMEGVLERCLMERGYVKFELTDAQYRQLRKLEVGSLERRQYLHSLASDQTILETQAVRIEI